MEQGRFKIIFDKIDELESEEGQSKGKIIISGISRAEMDEISELRKIVMETTEPEPMLYTMT